MGIFTDTKKAILDCFSKVNETSWKFDVISFDTTGGENRLCLRGNDGNNTDAEIIFYGVGYMSLPIHLGDMNISLAEWKDAQPIAWSLGQDAPPWIVCISLLREGGPPAKHFVAASRIEITLSGAKVLATQAV